MPDSQNTFVKARRDAPEGFFATEAAGLRWLSETSGNGGVEVVGVVAHDATSLTLERLTPATPDRGMPRAAEEFGTALAVTHAAGARSFGALPPGAAGYFFGPLDAPLSLPAEHFDTFGAFYAEARLGPVADGLALPRREADLLGRICASLRDGVADSWPDGRVIAPARVHGDLWSGNVMWTASGAVVIDPAACGHHPLADLAMLTMFGAPQLETILGAYAASAELPPDWRDQLPLHQLFGWLVHLRLFGAGYARQVSEALDASAQLLGV